MQFFLRYPFSVALRAASEITLRVTFLRSLESTKNVNVPVSWQSGVAFSRARAQLSRIVLRIILAEEPFSSRRIALNIAFSTSSGSDELVSRMSAKILSSVFIFQPPLERRDPVRPKFFHLGEEGSKEIFQLHKQEGNRSRPSPRALPENRAG